MLLILSSYEIYSLTVICHDASAFIKITFIFVMFDCGDLTDYSDSKISI